jgi:serpin B
MVGIMVTNTSHGAQPSGPNPDGQAVANAGNRFALDLYGKLSGPKGNLFFSPSSISSALAMTAAGARGETATQMSSVLHFDSLPKTDGGKAIHTAMGQLIAQLNAGGKQGAYQLSVANRLWGQKGFQFLDSFLGILRTAYGAELVQLDFGQAQAARQKINTWVEAATNGKIKDLIPDGGVNATTRLVLTNAVYFKGKWVDAFKADATKPAPFFLSAGDQVDVPMMYQKEHHEFGTAIFGDNHGLKILKLAYKADEQGPGRGLSMLVLLPDEQAGLGDLEKQLTADNVGKWSKDLRSAEVIVWLPKFKLTQDIQLSRVLSSLGMTSAFDPDTADFSGMDGKRDLFISEVFHKAFVDVNEEGTEAAAATGVAMRVMAMPVRDKPQEFKADHPFIFLIRDEASGSILFLGRVTDPRG